MPIDLATATPESFEPFVGQRFVARAQTGDVALVLEGIKTFPNSGIRDTAVVIDGVELPPRQAFALTFKGPEEPSLTQGTFALSHPKIENLALFLTVIRRDGDGFLYESVFN